MDMRQPQDPTMGQPGVGIQRRKPQQPGQAGMQAQAMPQFQPPQGLVPFQPIGDPLSEIMKMIGGKFGKTA
jgi:hypothetical protein